ncbi:MAG: hypothetical protein ACREBW_02005 [Candidatus Micrarchaeaceae archaeon]
MLPAITTTHAIPPRMPSANVVPITTTVRCCHCTAPLGKAFDRKSREALQAAHECSAKKLAKKPAASVPYN